MTALTAFAYADKDVRVVSIDGEPWFVLTDLVSVLGFARSASAVAERLDDGVRRTYPILDSLGRTQQATIVSEAGMYEVVIRSDKPEATAFRRWITREVLPSIRKRGGYLTPEAVERVLTDPDFIIGLATELKTERAQRRAAEARAAELTPSAAAWDVLVSASGDYAVADAAKILSRDPSISIGQRGLFAQLAALQWVFRQPGKRGGWRAYQSQIDTGRLVEKVSPAFQNARTGELEVPCPTVRITPKGLAALHKALGGTAPLDVGVAA